MTLKEKQNLIGNYRELVVTALNSIIDVYLDYLDPILNQKGNVKTALFKEQNGENFAVELNNDIKKFQDIKNKVLANEEDLLPLDIAYIGIALNFCSLRMENIIHNMMLSTDSVNSLKDKLQSKIDNNPLS